MSGFGGVLPWARRTLVERDKILTSEEFSAILGICQIVPGPNIMNLAVCVGSRFAGVRGALAAVLGLTIGPVLLVLLLAVTRLMFISVENMASPYRPCRARLMKRTSVDFWVVALWVPALI